MVQGDIIVNEQLLLALLLNSTDDKQCLEVENYFTTDLASAIFEGLKMTVMEKLTRIPRNIYKYAYKVNPNVTLSVIDSIQQLEHDPNGFENYYTECRKKYAQIQIQDHILKNTLTEVSTKDGLNVEAVEELIHKMRTNLDLATKTNSQTILDANALADRQKEHYERRLNGKAKYTCGDSNLDKHLVTGCSPCEISAFFGASGSGKSAKIMNKFSGLINKRVYTALFTLEMSAEASYDRLTSIRSGIPMEYLYKSSKDEGFDPVIYETAIRTQDQLRKKKNFRVIDDPTVSIGSLEEIVTKLQKEFNSQYILCIIDLGTMLKELSTGKAQDIEQGMNMLSEVAKRTGVHFMLVVQASRNADNANVTSIEQLDRLRPTQNDIKNSSAILERSRLVVSLFRPKYYALRLFGEDEDEVKFMDDIMEVTILKQSNGAVGQRLQYLYDAPTFRCVPYHPIKEVA